MFRFKPCFDRSIFEDLTNDWYCFECHSCDEKDLLIDCKTCFRAFHSKCIKDVKISEDFECIYCLKVREIDLSLRINTIDKKQLNNLFKIVIKNLENSVENFDIYKNYSIREKNEQNDKQINENNKLNVIIFNYLDLEIIREKVNNNNYNSVQELHNDFKHFVHNFLVFRIKGLNEYFDVYIENQLSELKLCYNCFNYSYNACFYDESKPYEWFTQVCDPSHNLVFARFSSHPYWPSKVLNIEDNGRKYYVQFFEPPKFERCYVNEESIKSIDHKFDNKKMKALREPLILVSIHIKKLLETEISEEKRNRFQNFMTRFEILKFDKQFDSKEKVILFLIFNFLSIV